MVTVMMMVILNLRMYQLAFAVQQQKSLNHTSLEGGAVWKSSGGVSPDETTSLFLSFPAWAPSTCAQSLGQLHPSESLFQSSDRVLRPHTAEDNVGFGSHTILTLHKCELQLQTDAS